MATITSLVEDPFSAAPRMSIAAAALAVLPPDATAPYVSHLFSVLAQWRESADNVFTFATLVSNTRVSLLMTVFLGRSFCLICTHILCL